MGNLIDARARFFRRYLLRAPQYFNAADMVEADAWGPVDQPIPVGALVWRDELSPARIFNSAGRQVGWRDCAGNEYAFTDCHLSKVKREHLATLPRTPLDAAPPYCTSRAEVATELAFLRAMSCAA